MAVNQTLDDMTTGGTSQCPKVFIQRDFSEGTPVRFLTKFPQELEPKIERNAFEYTVSQLNSMYHEAETLRGRTYCESCFACLTAYLVYMCMDSYYEKMLKKIARFVHEQNETVYLPRGLLLIDPAERGLRILEICILSDNSAR